MASRNSDVVALEQRLGCGARASRDLKLLLAVQQRLGCGAKPEDLLFPSSGCRGVSFRLETERLLLNARGHLKHALHPVLAGMDVEDMWEPRALRQAVAAAARPEAQAAAFEHYLAEYELLHQRMRDRRPRRGA
jgi:hypothetical protein